MSIMLIDRIGSVTFQNGLLRVDCVATGANNEEHSSGTLLITASQAGAVLQGLAAAMQELDRRLREQIRAAHADATTTAGAGEERATPALVPADASAASESRKR